MLLYNLAVTKNFKMKMFTQDESREKQRSSAKTTLIASELTQKESWQGTAPNNYLFIFQFFSIKC